MRRLFETETKTNIKKSLQGASKVQLQSASGITICNKRLL